MNLPDRWQSNLKMPIIGGGLSLSEEKSHLRGSCAPVTPSKPEQPSGRIYRYESAYASGGGMYNSTNDNSTPYVGHMDSLYQVQDRNKWGFTHLLANTELSAVNVTPGVRSDRPGNPPASDWLVVVNATSNLDNEVAGNWPPPTQLSFPGACPPLGTCSGDNSAPKNCAFDLNVSSQMSANENTVERTEGIPCPPLPHIAREGTSNLSDFNSPILGQPVAATQSNMTKLLLIQHASSTWQNNGGYAHQLLPGYSLPTQATSISSHWTSPICQSLLRGTDGSTADLLVNGNRSFDGAPVTPDRVTRGSRTYGSAGSASLFPADDLNNSHCLGKENGVKFSVKDRAINQANAFFDLRSSEGSLSLEPPQSAIDSASLKKAVVSQQVDHYEEALQTVDQQLSTMPSKDDHQIQGIDLNKTPPQKPKRKKHRPKVVRESKPKKISSTATPKHARTPKPVTPKQDGREKRKYVRRTSRKTSLDVTTVVTEQALTPADVGIISEEQATPPIDSRTGAVPVPSGRGMKSSCRRSLNFDLDTARGHVNSSCKRALNFDLEAQQRGRNLGSGDNSVFHPLFENLSRPPDLQTSINLELPSQVQILQSQPQVLPPQPETGGQCADTLHPEPSEFAFQCQAQAEIEVIVKKPRQGTMLDMNSLSTQIPSSIFLSACSKQPASIARKEPDKGNLTPLERKKMLDNLLHYKNIGQINSINIPASNSACTSHLLNSVSGYGVGFRRVIRNESTTDNSSNMGASDVEPLKKGSKRVYSETINFSAFCNANQSKANTFPLNTFKKIIAEENVHCCGSPKNKRSEMIHVEGYSFPGAKPVENNEVHKSQISKAGRSESQFDHTELNNEVQTKGIRSLCQGSAESTPLVCATAESIPAKGSSSLHAQRGIPLHHKLPDIDVIGTSPMKKKIDGNNGGTPYVYENHEGGQATKKQANLIREKSVSKKGRRKTKRLPEIMESISCSRTNSFSIQGHQTTFYCSQSALDSRCALGNKSLTETTLLNGFHIVQVPDILDYHTNSPIYSHGITPFEDLTDEIVQRFKHFSINGGEKIVTTETQNALVPYSADGSLIPYEGPFDPTKKRQRQRPKVALDDETNRVWNLLMWKEGSNEVDDLDPEKKKWWEEERRIFAGRTESFIARMHLVQGDRRFSQWKGSVVDSVIGVFLTQNVSDHLSSSAFMSLAAKFPFRPQANDKLNTRGPNKSPGDSEVSSAELEDRQAINLVSSDRGSVISNEVRFIVEKERSSKSESLDSSLSPCMADYAMGKQIIVCKNGPESSRESSGVTETPRALEDVVSSQNSISPQNSSDSSFQVADGFGSIPDSSSEVDTAVRSFHSNLLGSAGTSFMGLLQLQGPKIIQELYCDENAFESSYFTTDVEVWKRNSNLGEGLAGPCPSLRQMDFNLVRSEEEFTLHTNINEISVSMDCVDACIGENRCSGSASGITELQGVWSSEKIISPASEEMSDSLLPSSCSQNAFVVASCSTKEPDHLSIGSETRSFGDRQPLVHENRAQVETSLSNYGNNGEIVDVRENSSLLSKGNTGEITMPGSKGRKDGTNDLKMGMVGATDKRVKSKAKNEVDRKKDFDWDSLRRQICYSGTRKERSCDTMDSLDYVSLRSADVKEISDAIRERGMNNKLAERIKDFLDRLVHEHGSIDLEWLRDAPPDKAKEFLLSIRGLGLKSVECVRLLTLHHLAFPVDTNVGRICVRLGWVPLQPLPESLQLHLLELYPMLESIQKYLWPRLCKLDQRTLYELHYQMITFGKVFCTKSKPNCNACPMRAECRHFASAFASARLALPGPEDKSLVTSTTPMATSLQNQKVVFNPLQLPQPERIPHAMAGSGISKCEYFIEEPASPEPESSDASETAIEDAFWVEEPDEIPTIKLNFDDFTQNVQTYMEENKITLQEGDLSKALVLLTPEAASIPMPKLKNISGLRTEHQVYELPDSHELLRGLDPREPDDPCPYLLAIWSPGETAQSVQPPETSCGFQERGELCNKETCFSCNSIREAHAQTVRGTLLIPCRTAMRGSFPLNGTYFQVNEVFADHDSSIQPIDIPRALLWNLPRRTVYFGTSVPTIFRGLTTPQIQQCFWRGFVCVRGFDQKTRAPRPLMARLHLAASKLVKKKKGHSQTREE